VSRQRTERHAIGTRGERAPVTAVRARAYRIPTDAPEADGTLAWSSTTLVVAEVDAGGCTGLGYSYTDAAAAPFIRDTLASAMEARDALALPELHAAMLRCARNVGRRGLVATAISAVDCALWDLKARILGVPLVGLFGASRERVPLYGSGGFTTYAEDRLIDQLGGWAADGFPAVKMKIGMRSDLDQGRVETAHRAISGTGARLFVDANGAYTRKQALGFAERFAAIGVAWFEEPVSSDDREGLRLIRDRAPAPIEIAAGEYGYEPFYFRDLLQAGAVDVLQADATRCLGYTGLLAADALAGAFSTPLSLHCAPALHLHAALHLRQFVHQEWFHDHVRIEHMLLDGAPAPRSGHLAADLTRPGHGLSLKRKDAEQYLI